MPAKKRIPLFCAVLALCCASVGCEREAAADPRARKAVAAHADTGNARDDAFALAQSATAASGTDVRLAQFLSWETRAELRDCPANPSPAARLRLQSVASLVSSSVPGHTSDVLHDVDPNANLSAGFYYDPVAAARLCQVAVKGTNSPKLVAGEPAINTWWKSNGSKPAAIDPFPEGARAAVASFELITCADTSNRTMYVSYRNNPTAQHIAISLANKTNPATGQPCAGQAQAGARPIDAFYSVQFRNGDTYSGAKPGDFAVMIAMSLIRKTGKGWLWSTFWWEPGSAFALPQGQLQSAGSASAWNNYAMDAGYPDTSATRSIFNPNFNGAGESEPPGSNCARCHSSAIIPFPSTLPETLGPATPPAGTFALDSIFAPAKL